MECPHCRLINPPDAQRCDCGYDFETRRQERSLVHGTDPAVVRAAGERQMTRGWLLLGAAVAIGVVGYLLGFRRPRFFGACGMMAIAGLWAIVMGTRQSRTGLTRR